MTQIFRQQLAAVACVTMAALAVAAPAAGQDEPQPRELADWEREELQTLVEVVGAARGGELDPVEDPFDLLPSFLKGTDNNTYVPFTLTIDPAKIDGSSVTAYLYVDDPAPAAAAEEDDDSDDSVQEASSRTPTSSSSASRPRTARCVSTARSRRRAASTTCTSPCGRAWARRRTATRATRCR